MEHGAEGMEGRTAGFQPASETDRRAGGTPAVQKSGAGGTPAVQPGMNAVRAKRGSKLPVVLTPEETQKILSCTEGTAGLMQGVNIREVQALLGHKSVETTVVYTHVVRTMSQRPQSPLDTLG